MTIKVRAVIVHDGRVVVARESRLGREHLTLPGGRPNRRETLPDALVREVAEETGLDVRAGSLMYVAEVVAGATRQEVNVVFGADADADALSRPDAPFVLVGPGDADAERVMPPILDHVFADMADGWNGAPRWLGNLHQAGGGTTTRR
jgi:ADP-ribose pyrophosphatase YjhB (NUDIX family)